MLASRLDWFQVLTQYYYSDFTHVRTFFLSILHFISDNHAKILSFATRGTAISHLIFWLGLVHYNSLYSKRLDPPAARSSSSGTQYYRMNRRWPMAGRGGRPSRKRSPGWHAGDRGTAGGTLCYQLDQGFLGG